MSVKGVRRDKAALSSGWKPHPATAPAGSNRSSHGGNEVAEAFDYRDSSQLLISFAVAITSSAMGGVKRWMPIGGKWLADLHRYGDFATRLLSGLRVSSL
jgi:hypothetical protein